MNKLPAGQSFTDRLAALKQLVAERAPEPEVSIVQEKLPDYDEKLFYNWWYWRLRHPFLSWKVAQEFQKHIAIAPVLGTFPKGEESITDDLLFWYIRNCPPCTVVASNYLTHMLFSFALCVPEPMKLDLIEELKRDYESY